MSRANASYKLVILVVEDEFLIRDSIVHYLRDADCLVFEAQSGEQAIEMLRPDHPFDAVFTDIRMGGSLDGWDVGEACRAIWNDIAVIYTSGYPNDTAQNVSSSLFFCKPYRPQEILEACQNLCRLGQQSRSITESNGLEH